MRNTGSTAINGWTLAWTFAGNQTITNMWNALPAQAGPNVQARNDGWNTTIPAGGSATFGFQAAYSGANATPSAFQLNGAACSTA